MTDERMQAATAAWAARALPACVNVTATAKVLGFAEYHIQTLMRLRRLTRWATRHPTRPSDQALRTCKIATGFRASACPLRAL